MEKWTPNKNYHTVLTYIEATQRELEKEQMKMKKKPYNNLTKNERTSMKELSEQEDIIKSLYTNIPNNEGIRAVRVL